MPFSQYEQPFLYVHKTYVFYAPYYPNLLKMLKSPRFVDTKMQVENFGQSFARQYLYLNNDFISQLYLQLSWCLTQTIVHGI